MRRNLGRSLTFPIEANFGCSYLFQYPTENGYELSRNALIVITPPAGL